MNLNSFSKKGMIVSILIACFVIFVFVNERVVRAKSKATSGQYSLKVIEPISPDLREKFIFKDVIPGESYEGIVGAVNLSDDATVHIELQPVDATTTTEGTFALKPSTYEQLGIGDWLKFINDDGKEVRRLVQIVEEGTENVKFVINVPKNATPGDYAGAIKASDATPSESDDGGSGGAGISVKAGLGKRIYLSIPGEVITELKLLKYEYNKETKQIKIDVENGGNSIIEMQNSSIIISDLINGNVKDELKINSGQISPGDKTNAGSKWENQPRFGMFEASFILPYNRFALTGLEGDIEKKTIEGTIKIIILPVKAIIGLSVFLLLLLLLVLKKIFFIIGCKRKAKNSVPYTVRQGDNIQGISKLIKVKWKVLAKMNSLGSPYMLIPGQVILIPKNKIQMLGGQAPQQAPTPVQVPVVSNAQQVPASQIQANVGAAPAPLASTNPATNAPQGQQQVIGNSPVSQIVQQQPQVQQVQTVNPVNIQQNIANMSQMQQGNQGVGVSSISNNGQAAAVNQQVPVQAQQIAPNNSGQAPSAVSTNNQIPPTQ